ncbi:hypothetical protein [Roseateles saccharophilus]|uniref:Uncharacterized protein n=1 Tax=Roseateles saccharophilus TaxID=304 RepID=A0A4R3UMU8_ROSSA|nr:hypothetical protein [Roseateles saccharophilus]MDG0834185.1 hypothetical protein [Roseateles saccharophilus]TCU91294.1 hypothetical protein EV671_10269 [Roseateles saccharophilus]
MPRKPRQTRIEWLPGPAAQQALQILRALHPSHSQQALIDLALIRMAWADRFPPPQMPGRDRMRWALPAELKLPSVDPAPELRGMPPQGAVVTGSGMHCGATAARLTMQANPED